MASRTVQTALSGRANRQPERNPPPATIVANVRLPSGARRTTAREAPVQCPKESPS